MTAETQTMEAERKPRESFLGGILNSLVADVCPHADGDLNCMRQGNMPCQDPYQFRKCQVYMGDESLQVREETNKVLAEIQEAYNNQKK